MSKFGILKDPWRTPTPLVDPQESRPARPPIEIADAADSDNIDKDSQDTRYATIDIKGYGGITVDGTDQLSSAAEIILKFCVDNLSAIEQTLLQYGVLVAELKDEAPATPFYIRRSDGWTLTVPEANDRTTGRFQVIQAMLAVATLPGLKDKLKKYRIRPYRM